MTLAGGEAGWLRLTLAAGLGRAAQRELLGRFGLPEQIFAASAADLAATIGAGGAQQLLGSESAAAVERALAWAAEADNRLIPLGDPDYPQALLESPDPPILLYAKGRSALLHAPALAIVGARNATAQGERNAELFAATLARAGVTVVSGLALGIDGAAHRGALAGGGDTIAVLGTGIDRVYPARHRDLAHEIAQRGLLLSEFALGTPPVATNFPRRNRIIAGLARGVLVVEAALASGSLITARLAAEAGRDVFAVPGSIHSPLSKGCHRLIKDGAKLVDAVEDIVSELGLAAAPAAVAPVGADARDGLLELIGFDPVDLETLCARAGLSAEEIYPLLLALELDGRIASLPGARFQQLH